jgi:hypothetical protein
VTDLSSAFIEYLRMAESVRKAESEVHYDRSYFLDSEYQQLKRAERRFVAELFKGLDAHRADLASVCKHCKQVDCERKNTGWCLDDPDFSY